MRLWRILGAALLAVCVLGGVISSAQAATDPLFVFTPTPLPPPAPPFPPPTGFLEGPCGMAVDPLGHFYVSDYYHDAIDIYDQNANYADPKATGATGFLGQVPGIDSIDGPCGLAIAGESLYVNDYHRAVIRYDLIGTVSTILGPTPNGENNPTGVATDPTTGDLYVDQRTYVSVFDENGAAVMEGPPDSEVPLQIGTGSLQDGYGVAFSQYPGTAGRLYVPDASTNTIEVYDSATPAGAPIEEIDGSETSNGEFVSMRDASVAVDRVSGEIYVIDNLQPKYSERPQAIAYVFNPDGSYEGHLKFPVAWGMPAGLTVDNSETPTQGRVYLTSGNSSFGAIYAYGPDSATTAPFSAAVARLLLTSAGTGTGTIQSSLGDQGCVSACEEALPAGASVTLSADPEPGSTFAGFSGACTGTAPDCTVQVEEATAVRATFSAPAPQGPQQGTGSPPPTAAGGSVGAATAKRHRAQRPKHRHHRKAHRAPLRGVGRGR